MSGNEDRWSGRRGWAALAVLLLALATPAAADAISFAAPARLPVGDGPGDLVTADFNADGDPDLAAVNSESFDVSVLLGGPAASFSAATSFATGGSFPTALAVGRFNGEADTDPDLVALTDGPDAASVLLGGAGGSFGAPAAFPLGPSDPGNQPQDIAVGSFNSEVDSDPDIAVAHGGVQVLLGGAGGSFGPSTGHATGARPKGVAVADFNADSDPDIVTVNGNSGNISVLLGEAGGGFGTATNISITQGQFPPDSQPKIATGNFNGDEDQDPDLVLTRHGNIFVLLGGSGASFGAPAELKVGEGPGSVAVGDLNGDGDPDLAVANGYGNSVSVLLGATGGAFAPAVEFPAGNCCTGAPAIADFNADGDNDVAVVNSLADEVAVLLNREHAPAQPAFSGSDPASPANQNAPKLRGTAPAGTTVNLYTSPDCSGTPAATGTAAEFAAPGIAVTVPDDSTTSFRATATNAAGVTSDCSTATLAYIEHSSPPKAALSAAPTVAPAGTPITFDARGSTGFGIVRHRWDLDGQPGFELDTGASATTIHSYSSAQDVTAFVEVTNDIGSSVASVPVSIRQPPPPGPVGVSVVALDGDRRFTNDPRVNLVTVWPPLTRTLTISNDGGFGVSGSFPVAAQVAWTLDSTGDERLPKTVYVRFDGSTQTFTDDIILDETKPVVQSAALDEGTPTTAVAARTRRYRIVLKARDNASGVAQYQLGNRRRKSSPAALPKVGRKVARTVSARSPFRPRRVRVQDAAGNWSVWKALKTRR